MAAKVTLRDIAREVGLSPTAVSLVLNDRPCKISAENRRRIKEVARRKRYIPNQIARSLVTQHSQTVGLVVPNIESRFFSSLARRLELGCRERGHALFITNSDDSSENDSGLVRQLVNRGADGLFVVASGESGTDERLAATLSQLPVPYVLVDRLIDGLSCDKVAFNNEAGGYLACRHLLDAGHRRIACLANLASNTGRERVAGYERALAEKGVEPDPALVLDSTYYIPAAYEAARALLDTDATAVLATSDNIALGLLKRLYERGLRVPRDYSVVSYDNSAVDVLFEPALTSIEQNVDELSAAALELLFRRIEEGARGELGEPEERILMPRLVLKASVRTLS
ncbi:LacI family DNA-binding transcriptional regulator [Thermophilibacter provencensis]|uniref:LacI family DNA-binding transcriptional regulator n=1 Tax=Thermophilibacter provencensis TaxID=1852386 RepID=A0ABT7V4X3_9ACTN|nr:LacI family DNA-binding transcriptional regulator [Thermophilibacter provencensis]MDM8271643.1 LacI family DNA-binding transcriptional regulator [Thermophilibacter provencensis]